ncbi:MAG: extracellular solute-binding protein [Clostridia bacterium]|nr:extracellular solute-binding protein [Clostridia bacterium]
MKKFLALLLAAMMLLSVASFASADDVVELEFLYHKSETDAMNAMQAVINQFNEENPGIKVNFVQIPDAATVLQTRATQNDLPDMFGVTTSTTYELMFENGLIMDLTGQPFLDNVEASTLALSAYQGKIYRMPYSLSCYGLYVRTDIFEENNIELPETWEDLMAACEKLQAAGIYGFGLPDKDMVYQRMERMMSMLANNDDEFKAIAAGEMDPHDSKVLKGYAEASLDIAKYTNPESKGAGYDESYQLFLNKQAAMTINGQWSLGTLLGFDPDLKIAMIPLPNPLGEQSNVIVSIDTSFCISANTKHPEECLKFMEFLSKTETAQTYTDTEGSPNVIKGVVYNVKELEKINDAMAAGHTALSLNAVWPSGLRKALGDAATNLILDGDLEAFYADAQLTIEDYYNN